MVFTEYPAEDYENNTRKIANTRLLVRMKRISFDGDCWLIQFFITGNDCRGRGRGRPRDINDRDGDDRDRDQIRGRARARVRLKQTIRRVNY